MENKRILVIGGFGYIGKEITLKLIERGYKVSVLSRNPIELKEVISLKGSVLYKEFLKSNIKNFDTIIYLAAIIKSLNKSKYKENIIGLKNTIEVMHLNKIKKIIYFSTQNIYIKDTGDYGNSKKQCDPLVLNSGLRYIIIRPNYVYGIDKKNYFYYLANIIKKIRLCPIIGSGNYKFQPINKKDVAQIIVKVLLHFKPNKIIDLSGKTTLSINEVVNIIENYTGIKSIKIHLPLWFLKLFKRLIPFDVEGFTDDRLAISTNKNYKPSSDIHTDLQQIVKL